MGKENKAKDIMLQLSDFPFSLPLLFFVESLPVVRTGI
jgi:hypothetical protein